MILPPSLPPDIHAQVAAAARDALPSLLEGALVPPASVATLAEVAAAGATADEFSGAVTVIDTFELNK